MPQPWPGQHASVPQPPWASQQPAQPAPTAWQQPPADDVMEISDDEVSPVPTAPPPPQSRPNPLPPLNMSVGNDSVDDLRSALLDEVPSAPAAAAEPPPVKLPALPLFGGAGFSKAAPPERKVEATAVSSLLPGPADDLPLVDAAGSKGAETQIEAAAANAFSDSFAADDIAEASVSQVTEISDVELATGEVPTVSPSGVTELPSTSVTEVLPDLPMLEKKAAPSVSAEPLSAEVVIDPTPSMVMDAGAVEAVLDPTPSMMLDVPPLEEPARGPALLEVAALASESAPGPIAQAALLDVPALVSEPAPIAEAPLLEVPTLLDVPVLASEVTPIAEAALLDVPVLASEPASAPIADAPLLDVPVIASEPVAVLEVPEPAPPMVAEASVVAEPIAAANVETSLLDVPALAPETVEVAATEPESVEVSFSDAPVQVAPLPPVAAPPVAELEATVVVDQQLSLEAPSVASAPFLEDSVPATQPSLSAAPAAAEQSFDVSMSEGDSNWAAVVEASRAPEPVAPTHDELPVIESTPEPVIAGTLQELPLVSGDVAPVSAASSAFDALAIPPPLPSSPSTARAKVAPHPTSDVALDSWDDTDTQNDLPVFAPPVAEPAPAPKPEALAAAWDEAPAEVVPQAEVAPWAEPAVAEAAQPSTAPAASWEAPAEVAPQTEVFASSWEEAPPPAEVAPQTDVFASSWEEAPAPAEPAPQTEVFAASWDAGPASSDVFVSNWDNSPPAPELSGKADDRLELASNAEFIEGSLQPELPTIDVGDVAIDNEPFEVESGPAASLATGVVDSSVSSVDDAPIELSTNADFLGAQALTSTGESWQRSDAGIEVAEEPEGEIIQGIVVEEEPAADVGWDAAIPAPAPVRALDTRVVVPVPPAPRPPPVAAAPPPQRAPAPTIQPTAPVVQPVTPVVQPPPRTMADQLFDRSGSVRGGATPVLIRGDHRVILHTMEGQVKRGALKDPDLGAESLSLEGTAGGIEAIALGRVKAIFFMLAPGARSPAGDGQKVRVTFKDGRQVAGFSRDHQQGGPGFFVVPADNRTNTERIYIYRHGVQAVGIEG